MTEISNIWLIAINVFFFFIGMAFSMVTRKLAKKKNKGKTVTLSTDPSEMEEIFPESKTVQAFKSLGKAFKKIKK